MKEKSESDIAEMQRWMGAWWTRNFGHLDHNENDASMMTLLALGEEVGELYRGQLKQEEGIRGTKEQWAKEIEKECGDVFITLAIYACHKGINLAKAIRERWEVVEKRDWRTNPITGGKEREEEVGVSEAKNPRYLFLPCVISITTL